MGLPATIKTAHVTYEFFSVHRYISGLVFGQNSHATGDRYRWPDSFPRHREILAGREERQISFVGRFHFFKSTEVTFVVYILSVEQACTFWRNDCDLDIANTDDLLDFAIRRLNGCNRTHHADDPDKNALTPKPHPPYFRAYCTAARPTVSRATISFETWAVPSPISRPMTSRRRCWCGRSRL